MCSPRLSVDSCTCTETFFHSKFNLYTVITPLLIGERSIVMSVSVRVCVCLSAIIYLRNYTSNLHVIFLR